MRSTAVKECSAIPAALNKDVFLSASPPSMKCTISTRLDLPALLRVCPSVEPSVMSDSSTFRPRRKRTVLNVLMLLLTARIMAFSR